MLLIAGLGNPDEEYLKTRHNIGYKIIIALCDKLGYDFLAAAQTYRANQFLKTKINEQDVVFCLPLGYMNNSGQAIKQLMEFYGDNTSKDLWVVHDDTEVPFGTIKVKSGGTSGGHNGIKSIDDTISPNYWRIRVGVGRPSSPEHDVTKGGAGGQLRGRQPVDLADYVLAAFSRNEQAELPSVIDQTVSFLVKSIKEGKLETKTFNTKNTIKNGKKDTDKSD